MKLPKKTFAIFTAAYWAVAVITISLTVALDRPTVNAATAPSAPYSAHGFHVIHEDSLFNPDGTINDNVLVALKDHLELMNIETQYNTANGYLETTAGHFSNYAISTNDQTSNTFEKASGAMIIKLFPTVGARPTSGDDLLTRQRVWDLSNQWFQLVYRAQDGTPDGRDVLTLWALNPYTESRFSYNEGSSELLGIDFEMDGNYSASIARDVVLSNYIDLTENYTKYDQYFAAPADLPGNWQANAFQTGTRLDGESYGSGATGYYYVDDWFAYYDRFNLMNGMDGLGQPFEQRYEYYENDLDDWVFAYKYWKSSVVSMMSDKIWLPSAFEVLYMGNDKEVHEGYGTYIEGNVTLSRHIPDFDNPEFWPGGPSYMYLPNQSADIRHGLWQLNGYDRSSPNTYYGAVHESWSQVWTRSGSICEHADFDIDNVTILSRKGGGDDITYSTGAGQAEHSKGIRPALHLNIALLSAGKIACPCCGM